MELPDKVFDGIEDLKARSDSKPAMDESMGNPAEGKSAQVRGEMVSSFGMYD